ncbi:MAG: hypothetical protein Q8K64_08230 [Sediminibacterium sp.]|nr:hypothetical protein [Sediminibacterium sp.]
MTKLVITRKPIGVSKPNLSSELIGVLSKPKSNWKSELKRLKLENIKNTSPDFYELSGGERMKIKAYDDTSANGLTKCIIDWINFKGGSATRINCTGQVRRINGEMKWTPGTTRIGVSDVHACVKGRHCSIEVKIGKDRMSEAQYKEQGRIEAAGGLYYVAKDMESFVEWYSKTFDHE